MVYNRKHVIDLSIDINPDEMKRARLTGIYKNVQVINIARNNLPEKYFATVLANGVLEHIPNLQKAGLKLINCVYYNNPLL